MGDKAVKPSRPYSDNTPGPTDLPRNTTDPRYPACTDHHPACDCREAVINEDYIELYFDWELHRATLRAVLHLLEGGNLTGEKLTDATKLLRNLR